MEYLLTVKHVQGDDEEAIVPDGVVEIGAGAFRNMRNLKRIVLPTSCTTVGDFAFDNCRALEQVEFLGPLASLGTYAFKNCSSLEHIALPQTLDTIPQQAFARCSKLVSIEGTAHVSHIGLDAFTGCVSLASLDARNATTIGDRAFSGCRHLEHVELGSSLQSIGHYAFRSCASLNEITLPDGVISLGTNLFSGNRDIEIHASESVVQSFPNAFPRKLTLQFGIIRPQDVRDLSAQFKRNHAVDAEELRLRKNELVLLIEALHEEISHLGVMDLKQRDAAIGKLDAAVAELDDVQALLDEIDHPSLRSLAEEFGGKTIEG